MLVRLGPALLGGVHVYEGLFAPFWWGGHFCRSSLFPLVVEIMLSGPRLLLSALPLECMCRACCCESDNPVSFVCLVCSSYWRFPCFLVLPHGFSFVVSLCIFLPLGSAGVEGRS